MIRRIRRDDVTIALELLQIVTVVVAVIGLGLAIVDYAHLSDSRRRAAEDSCLLLRGLVFAATTNAPKQRAAAAAYIHRTPLRNCEIYARKTVK